MTEQDESREVSRREIRRKRRKRNQMIAYVSVAAFVIACIAGIGVGVHSVMGMISDKQQEAELAKKLAEKQEAEAQAAEQAETEMEMETESYTEDDL